MNTFNSKSIPLSLNWIRVVFVGDELEIYTGSRCPSEHRFTLCAFICDEWSTRFLRHIFRLWQVRRTIWNHHSLVSRLSNNVLSILCSVNTWYVLLALVEGALGEGLGKKTGRDGTRRIKDGADKPSVPQIYIKYVFQTLIFISCHSF